MGGLPVFRPSTSELSIPCCLVGAAAAAGVPAAAPTFVCASTPRVASTTPREILRPGPPAGAAPTGTDPPLLRTSVERFPDGPRNASTSLLALHYRPLRLMLAEAASGALPPPPPPPPPLPERRLASARSPPRSAYKLPNSFRLDIVQPGQPPPLPPGPTADDDARTSSAATSSTTTTTAPVVARHRRTNDWHTVHGAGVQAVRPTTSGGIRGESVAQEAGRPETAPEALGGGAGAGALRRGLTMRQAAGARGSSSMFAASRDRWLSALNSSPAPRAAGCLSPRSYVDSPAGTSAVPFSRRTGLCRGLALAATQEGSPRTTLSAQSSGRDPIAIPGVTFGAFAFERSRRSARA